MKELPLKERGCIRIPYASDSIKLSDKQDRRRKLTDEQYEEIKVLYADGMTVTKIAEEYGVSRRTISIIVSPAAKATMQRYCSEHWREYKEDKKAHAETMRKYRKYKHELYLKGELN